MTLLELSSLLGNFGEFGGALLLFFSLVYVGIQINQNTRITRANTTHSITNTQTMTCLEVAVRGELAEILTATTDDGIDLAELTSEQSAQAVWYLVSFLGMVEDVYHQQAQGLLSEDFLRARSETLKRLFQSESTKSLWQFLKPQYTSDYGDWVDLQLIQQ